MDLLAVFVRNLKSIGETHRASTGDGAGEHGALLTMGPSVARVSAPRTMPPCEHTRAVTMASRALACAHVENHTSNGRPGFLEARELSFETLVLAEQGIATNDKCA